MLTTDPYISILNVKHIETHCSNCYKVKNLKEQFFNFFFFFTACPALGNFSLTTMLRLQICSVLLKFLPSTYMHVIYIKTSNLIIYHLESCLGCGKRADHLHRSNIELFFFHLMYIWSCCYSIVQNVVVWFAVRQNVPPIRFCWWRDYFTEDTENDKQTKKT